MPTNPKVFISYAWESDDYKDWIRAIADRLIQNGVDVTLDQYDCPPGTNFLHFMEEAVSNSDRVLIFLSEKYKAKADGREKGVGYEGMIISAEIYEDGLSSKFIPCLAMGNNASSTPIFLKGRAGLDFRQKKDFEQQFEVLLKTIFSYSDKPTVGSLPKFKSISSKPSPNTTLAHQKMSNKEKITKINLMIAGNEIDAVCKLLINYLGDSQNGSTITIILRDFKEVQKAFQIKSMSKDKKQEEEAKLVGRLMSFLHSLDEKDLNKIELDG